MLGWDEPVDYSPLFSVCGMNSGYMVTKMLYDNLTNFAGYGVEDPRADHIIPWAYSPLRAAFDTKTNKWYINTSNEARLGDTVYVEETSDCKGYFGNPSLLYCRAGSGKFESAESGTFYTRVSSPTYIGTYSECCFIRAEVLFKRGDRQGAFDAYKKGIQASCELMNDKLNVWIQDARLGKCPSFIPMTDEAIDNFTS